MRNHIHRLTQLTSREELLSLLVFLSLIAVIILESQSAASYPTYLLSLAVFLGASHWNKVLKTSLFWMICGMLGYLFLSCVWSEEMIWREMLSIFVRGLLVFSFVIAVAECCISPAFIPDLSRKLSIIGGVVVCLTLINYFWIGPAEGRLQGLGQLDAHNIGALVFGVILIFSIHTFFNERTIFRKISSILIAIFCATAIGLSGSRNAWFSTLIGTITLLMAYRITHVRRFIIVLLSFMGCIVLLFIALVFMDASKDLLLPRGDSFRLSIWSTAILSTLDQNILIGHGILTNDNILIDGTREFQHSHNLYLSVFYKGGLIALSMFFLVIFTVLHLLLQNFSDSDAKLALAILALALPSYVFDSHQVMDKVGAVWYMLWLPAGISLSLAWRKSRSKAYYSEV